MTKDLTNSDINRQNILNNSYALEKAELYLELDGIPWKEESIFTKTKVSQIFQVDKRTIERYLEQHNEELVKNGYRVLKGKEFKEFKEHISNMKIQKMIKTPALGIFSFKTVLNLAMLITESEKAKSIRSEILDIVLDIMAQKAGGETKYTRQKKDNYLPSSYKEKFTDALDYYLEMDSFKYTKYTSKIYEILFLENVNSYKKMLELKEKNRINETLYLEVLNLVSSIENGIAEDMKNNYQKLGRKLTPMELSKLFEETANNPYLKPIMENVRKKVTSHYLSLKESLDKKIENYRQTGHKSNFDKFLGETSKSLEERLSNPDTLAVLKRLKDR